MPLNPNIKKVLVIGSGPIVIGQAAEFDYAGTQACRALKEDGIEIVLVNSNPATIMTDHMMADKIYIEPLTLTTVKRIIEKEKPDSILSGLGGQTGLTLCMQLAHEGFLERHGIRLLGSMPETIDRAEDRQLFKETMESIGQPCIPSEVVTDVEAALKFADEIGYPVIVRPAFTLGGSGGGIAQNEDMLKEIAPNGLMQSPNSDSGSRGIPRPPCARLPEPSVSVWGTYRRVPAFRGFVCIGFRIGAAAECFLPDFVRPDRCLASACPTVGGRFHH